jgi:hypothetical protein
MLAFRKGKVSDCKVRLFAVAYWQPAAKCRPFRSAASRTGTDDGVRIGSGSVGGF